MLFTIIEVSLPETSGVVRARSFRQSLRVCHFFAVAESQRIMGHPRQRLARTNCDVSVVAQPIVRFVDQFTVLCKNTILIDMLINNEHAWNSPTDYNTERLV